MKKLLLAELKVKSFITSLSKKENDKIKGGTYPTNSGCETDTQCQTQVGCSPPSYSPCNTGGLNSDTQCPTITTDSGDSEEV